MNEIPHVQLLQLAMTALAGIGGVGITLGLFSGGVKSLKQEVASIKIRQSKLRGEDNGVVPIFMGRGECITYRDNCGTRMCASLTAHQHDIKRLDNFARWWMQKEGLSISDINKVLDPQ